MTEIIKKLDKLSDGHTEIIKTQIESNATLKYMGEKVGKMDIKIDESIVQNEELKDQMEDLNNKILRLDSWKNGQILYQNQINEFRLDMQKRVPPLEEDLTDRLKKSTGFKGRISNLGWKILDIFAVAFVLSVVLIIGLSFASGDFWQLFTKLIT